MTSTKARETQSEHCNLVCRVIIHPGSMCKIIFNQDSFTQSTTRLYWIADKWFAMFRNDQAKSTEASTNVGDFSALGIRHVGYSVLAGSFAPFVSASGEVVWHMTIHDEASDAFRWSLTLILKVLVRTVREDSTIVMKAINTNQESVLVKAVSVAPCGKTYLARSGGASLTEGPRYTL